MGRILFIRHLSEVSKNVFITYFARLIPNSNIKIKPISYWKTIEDGIIFALIGVFKYNLT